MVPGRPCALCAVCDRGAPQFSAAAADTRVRVCLHSVNHGKNILVLQLCSGPQYN